MIFFVWELKPLSYLHFLGALVNFAWAKINVVNLIKSVRPLFLTVLNFMLSFFPEWNVVTAGQKLP